MKIEFSDPEVIALSKALRFVRFQSEEYDARYLAGSPLIAEVYKRVSEAAGDYYKSKNIPFPEKWPSIETIKNYVDVIKTHIKNTDNWADLAPDQRISFLNTLIYPYKVSEDTINDLLRFGDETHTKRS